jgi:cobalamin biosynthesis protein CbiG
VFAGALGVPFVDLEAAIPALRKHAGARRIAAPIGLAPRVE